MSFSIGIIGLPNVGKSTLFKALTKKAVLIADYPFTTIHPNIGLVQVPDVRLEKIAQVIKPEKVIPTVIEFIDIAGLVKGAHKGEGLGNQFLAQIRNCDAILQIVKCFGDNINPGEDIETIKAELELKDRESQEKENLLSKKPIIYLLNIDKKTQYQPLSVPHLTINLKEELEISELSDSEKRELKLTSQLDQLILACYNILDLVSFYTVEGGKESRAWTLKKGLTITKAGRIVHSDFEEKFIRAEVVDWKGLVESGGWKEAREKGLIQTVGRDYIVQDGDVIEFKI